MESEEPANELVMLLGPFWSGEHVRVALGLPSRAALAAMCRDGLVLALTTADGDVLYPAFQFQRHT